MTIRTFNTIIIPIYIYIFVLLLYFNLRGINNFVFTDLSNALFIILVYLGAILLSILMYVRQKVILKGDYVTAFIFTAIPGFISGANTGLGLNGMAHGDTIFDYIYSILIIGIPFALVFGNIGTIMEFLFRLYKRITNTYAEND